MEEKWNLKSPDYDLFSVKDFFGFYSNIRMTLLIFILISFILNFCILLSIIRSKRKKVSVGLFLLASILIINFIHILSYLPEWIIKEKKIANKSIDITEKAKLMNNDTINAGGLLVGNLNSLGWCKVQAIFLILSSISQDILINIFYFVLNMHSQPKVIHVFLVSLILGIIFPLIVSLIYLFMDALGINDHTCYVKKIEFTKPEPNKDILYSEYGHYTDLSLLIIFIKFISLVYSLFLLVKIIKYIKLQRLKFNIIFKFFVYLFIQIFSIIIGIGYSIISIINMKWGEKLSDIYIILNSLDSILFPLFYSLSYGVYKHLCFKHICSSCADEEDEDDFNNDSEYEENEDKDDNDDNDDLDDKDVVKQEMKKLNTKKKIKKNVKIIDYDDED